MGSKVLQQRKRNNGQHLLVFQGMVKQWTRATSACAFQGVGHVLITSSDVQLMSFELAYYDRPRRVIESQAKQI